MKKYIVSSISFILHFLLFQVMSGMFLTFTYTPDIAESWNLTANLTHEAVIKRGHSSLLLTLFIGILSASIAYFIPKKIYNNGSVN